MVTKLFMKPRYLPLSILYLSPNSIFLNKPSQILKFPILSFSSISITSQTSNPDPEIPYGPSLRKGTTLSLPLSQSPFKTPQPSHQAEQQQEENDDALLNEELFIRVFDIAALRVPAKDCFALESRLRGHLLNWPRIRNIARVPGDDVDRELAELVGNQNDDVDNDDDALVSLHRRINGKAEGDGEPLSPVLYREKLVNTFDSTGFVNFRNLAKMSRPNKGKRKMKKNADDEEDSGEEKKRMRRNDFAVVEVVEDEEDEGEDLKGLLGNDFKWRKWRGSTRLLLLDERYANKCLEELPKAIKVSPPFL